MKIVFESEIGDDGLKMFVQIHPDDPRRPILVIQRDGTNERELNSATELRILGEAIRLAGLELIEKGL